MHATITFLKAIENASPSASTQNSCSSGAGLPTLPRLALLALPFFLVSSYLRKTNFVLSSIKSLTKCSNYDRVLSITTFLTLILRISENDTVEQTTGKISTVGFQP